MSELAARRLAFGHYVTKRSLRTFDLQMARHERACGSPKAGRRASRMVLRLTGIEPVTPGLGNQCSIQLSYRRTRQYRNTE